MLAPIRISNWGWASDDGTVSINTAGINTAGINTVSIKACPTGVAWHEYRRHGWPWH
jgi:hypothetical protein